MRPPLPPGGSSPRAATKSRARIDAGYEGWDWGNAALDLALCHQVTQRVDYATAALTYLRALLDDRRAIGDGAGGDAAVRHDSGYPIRSRGCFGAIAYDWLHDAPGMTAELRKHVVDWLDTWTKWLPSPATTATSRSATTTSAGSGPSRSGASRPRATTPALSTCFAGSQRLYTTGLEPAYRKLAGGDFPEGWQYGESGGCRARDLRGHDVAAGEYAGAARAVALAA